MEGTEEDLDLFFGEAEEKPAEPLATDSDLVETMKQIAQLRDHKAALEADLKGTNKDIALLQDRVLATFDARGIGKMSVEGRLFYVQSSPMPSVKDNAAFCAWLDERNMGEIAKRTVNFQTLRSWVKTRMERGGELPEENVLAYFIKRDIRVRKG